MTVITNENFEQEIMQEKKPVVVDFWAQWCGPCMMLKPVLEELEPEMPEVKFCKINVDEQQELAVASRIESIPTLLVIREAKVVGKLIGFREKAELRKEIEKLL